MMNDYPFQVLIHTKWVQEDEIFLIEVIDIDNRIYYEYYTASKYEPIVFLGVK